MKKPLALPSLLALVIALAACSQTTEIVPLAAEAAFPEVIALPDGFQPEGVATGRGHTLYAGSLANGSVYEIDLRTGVGSLAVPAQADRIAVGMAVDDSRNRLFVAGGPSGHAYVYDAATGEPLEDYEFATDPTFVNDVILTQEAAYFTDSFNSVLYVLPLAPNGALPETFEMLPLTGDYAPGPGFNVNGIEASADGRALVIVQSSLGRLYRVDPESGVATLIDLGGDTVASGDGLLLQGHTLYVVQNFLNQLAVVELAPDLGSGTVVETITDPAFDIPTTAAGFGSSIYAVNARFGTPPTPDTEYQVVQVRR